MKLHLTHAKLRFLCPSCPKLRREVVALMLVDVVTSALLHLREELWHDPTYRTGDLHKTHIPYKCVHTTVPTTILLHFL